MKNKNADKSSPFTLGGTLFVTKRRDILRRTHKIHAATEVNVKGRDKTGRLPRKIRTLGKSTTSSVAFVRNAKFILVLLHVQAFDTYTVSHINL